MILPKDAHEVCWKFNHIYGGTPRRHLLTTGFSDFVNQKKLVAGDSVVSDGEIQTLRISDEVSSNPNVRAEWIIEAANLAAHSPPFEVVYYPHANSHRISWFMGTVSSVQVADPFHWPNSPWGLLQVACLPIQS
ncbi:hypothetical protein Nepgr_013107 [Nepenthes gracilis]|uniref:TF-B3 domain-containing protein n=1 Tax=Nepenthes gracilis TaxID=150966 RepID=A0AAD3XNZ5_NEPGR|nr:hypothetical protein Nepgr_013107 [Nepenthes gracilis]